MTTQTSRSRVTLIAICLISAVFLSACSSSNMAANPPASASASQSASSTLSTHPYAVPLSCIETRMLTELKKTLPAAKFINTEWTPAKGTELADVLSNSGIACSWGVQSAGVGVTVMWTDDAKGLFETRVAKWLEQGYEKVDIPRLEEKSAYLLHKPQSTSQEFNVWQLDLEIQGFWVQVGITFGDTLEASLPLVQAAVNSLTPRASKIDIVGCYVAKIAKDRFILNITDQSDAAVKAKIAYLNFEKDSSTGTFIGTYKNGILDGIYSFKSEGVDSRRELIYRQVNNGFISGFGAVEVVGDLEKLKRPLDLKWDSTFAFVPSGNCPLP